MLIVTDIMRMKIRDVLAICPIGSEAEDRGFISRISYAKLPRFEIYHELYSIVKHREETCPVGACGVI